MLNVCNIVRSTLSVTEDSPDISTRCSFPARDTQYMENARPAGGRYSFPPGAIPADTRGKSRPLVFFSFPATIIARYISRYFSFNERRACTTIARGIPRTTDCERNGIRTSGAGSVRERKGNRRRAETRREGAKKREKKERKRAHTWCPWAQPRELSWGPRLVQEGPRQDLLSTL